MRFINELYAAEIGQPVSNEQLLPRFERAVDRLPLDEPALAALREFVRFQLIGERSRRVFADVDELTDFQHRAGVFERGADAAIEQLADRIAPAAGAASVAFDAVITTTSTGNLMPGLSYRLARRLGPLVRRDCMLLDLANVGCTGSSKALHLARSLDPAYRNILVAAVELPTTLVNLKATEFDLWQGNCTFGDGAAAVWISNDPEQGPYALALEEIRYQQFADTGLPLIRWGYGDYYGFRLANHKTFESDVKQHIAGALRDAESLWREEPRWAVHPAGITLLMRLTRELKMPPETVAPSVAHYREHSNMSSASVLHVLRDLAATTPAGAAINILTMGAGFNVVYGRVRRVR